MRSNTQDTPTKRPRVRFSETSEMVLVTKLSETPNKHSIWFNQDELDLFKANTASYIHVVRLHIAKRHAPTASNILGMEKFLTQKLTEEYKVRRGKLAKEVMRMTRQQQMLAARVGSGNDRLDYEKSSADVLAKIAADNSKWARERARAAALFLEQDQEKEKKRELKHRSMHVQQDEVHFNFTASPNRRQFEVIGTVSPSQSTHNRSAQIQPL